MFNQHFIIFYTVVIKIGVMYHLLAFTIICSLLFIRCMTETFLRRICFWHSYMYV